MFLRHFIQIVHVQQALVFHLRIVKEVALDPSPSRRLLRSRAELVHDAADRHELHLEWITDQHFVEQRGTGRVVVTVGEARHDCHLPGVDRLGFFRDEALDVGRPANGNEAPCFHRKGFRSRRAVIHGVDLRVENNEIGAVCVDGLGGGRRHVEPRCGDGAGDIGSGQTQEFSTAVVFDVFHKYG